MQTIEERIAEVLEEQLVARGATRVRRLVTGPDDASTVLINQPAVMLPVGHAERLLAPYDLAAALRKAGVFRPVQADMSEETRSFLDKAQGFVEADSSAMTQMWSDHARQSSFASKTTAAFEWAEVRGGIVTCVGRFGGEGVYVSFWRAVIEGVSVAFYSPSGVVVHYDLVHDWLQSNAPAEARRPDGSLRRCGSDNSFVGCIRDWAKEARNG